MRFGDFQKKVISLNHGALEIPVLAEQGENSCMRGAGGELGHRIEAIDPKRGKSKLMI